MSDRVREALDAVLAMRLPALCAVHGRQCSEQLLDAWADALEGEDPNAVDAAMRLLLRQPSRWMPTPGDLVTNLHGTIQQHALEAWPTALRAIRGGRAPEDPLVAEALRVIGGVQALGDRSESERQWTRRDFLAAYEAAAAREQRESVNPRLGDGAIGRLEA